MTRILRRTAQHSSCFAPVKGVSFGAGRGLPPGVSRTLRVSWDALGLRSRKGASTGGINPGTCSLKTPAHGVHEAEELHTILDGAALAGAEDGLCF